eukprot:CAMPEP_0195511046 /NCGR_PEP_ID=MMETSP0794_2-20130614/3504_1 /TAXON_ID=515487 /ORGANISM="Stephanopyxis turris, Strain CCMP 815" /LENGTH=104 /DNA_ID=CAMNT_0040638583 /DNA_START=489 /DNA_END=803 /DNA_ORIENTATION=-
MTSVATTLYSPMESSFTFSAAILRAAPCPALMAKRTGTGRRVEEFEVFCKPSPLVFLSIGAERTEGENPLAGIENIRPTTNTNFMYRVMHVAVLKQNLDLIDIA